MPTEFKHTELDNQLTIVAEVNPAAASMAAGFFVRAGSRDETDEVAGVSHFLEHMVFKGTPRRSPFDVSRDFDDIGAQYNAFTSEENTLYYGAVLPEFQTPLVDILGDILRPSLREDDFETEKNVIIDEIARYEDSPSFRVYEKLLAEHFKGHPLGRNVLGTPDSIRALTCEQMRDYFDRRYSPGNVTVVAVGNLDFDAFVEKVAEMCLSWSVVDVSRDTPPPPPRATTKIITDPKVAREHVGLMSPAPSGQSESRFAAHLLATVIGDTTGSRLFYALVDPAIADDASMAYDLMDHAGAFVTFVTADPDRAARAVEIARDELKRFMDGGATPAELDSAKNKIASAATLKGEIPMGRLSAVGFDWVYRREYVPLSDQIATLFAVTCDDLLDVARTFDLTVATTLALGPLESL